MKALIVWIAVHAAIFVGGALADSAMRTAQAPGRVAIVLDSSFPMREVWTWIPRVLDDIERHHPGSKFAVVTRRALDAPWLKHAAMTQTQPFAPRNLERLKGSGRLEEADRVYLLSNASEEELKAVARQGWTRWPIDTNR